MTPWLALACVAPWAPVAIVACRADNDALVLMLMFVSAMASVGIAAAANGGFR